PRRSVNGAEGEWVTAEELRAMRFDPVLLDQHALKLQGASSLDRVVAATKYESSPLLPRVIQAFKYHRVPAIGAVLGGVLAETSYLLWSADDALPVLCPVPLYWMRQFQRGFNQAAVLAQSVATQRQCTVQHLLRRTRSTGHQAWRHRAER